MKRLLRVCFLILSLATGAFAQSATLSGTAKDQSGAILPGVEVTATNTATSFSRSVVTGERGDYVIPQLPIGTYEVKAELPGFKTEARRGIVLQIDQRLSVN